jgi:hypothetical protein
LKRGKSVGFNANVVTPYDAELVTRSKPREERGIRGSRITAVAPHLEDGDFVRQRQRRTAVVDDRYERADSSTRANRGDRHRAPFGCVEVHQIHAKCGHESIVPERSTS